MYNKNYWRSMNQITKLTFVLILHRNKIWLSLYSTCIGCLGCIIAPRQRVPSATDWRHKNRVMCYPVYGMVRKQTHCR